jgi:hypothetical protein
MRKALDSICRAAKKKKKHCMLLISGTTSKFKNVCIRLLANKEFVISL